MHSSRQVITMGTHKTKATEVDLSIFTHILAYSDMITLIQFTLFVCLFVMIKPFILPKLIKWVYTRNTSGLSGKKYIVVNYFCKMLHHRHFTGFWICLVFSTCQGSEYASVLNIPGFWIYQGSDYLCLWFSIYEGSEYARILNMPLVLNMSLVLNMQGVWIYQNSHKFFHCRSYFYSRIIYFM